MDGTIYAIVAALFVATSAATIALLIGCARAVTRTRLELQGQLALQAQPGALGHSLSAGHLLPANVVASFREPRAPGLVAVLSEHCPSCWELARKLVKSRPPRLDIVLMGEDRGELRTFLQGVGHVLDAEAGKALVEAAGIRGTPVLFTRDGQGRVIWFSMDRPTDDWAHLAAEDRLAPDQQPTQVSVR